MHDSYVWGRLVGCSDWTARTWRRILQAAPYNYPVLITGPSGTGKSLIARAVHQHSARHDRPWIPFQAAHARGDLGWAQLMGQAAGAFAWMPSETLGACQCADGGTLCIDDIDQLDLAAQDRLLEFLRTKRVCPVAGEPRKPINVRLMATSTIDLAQEVRAGRFRFELLHRLNALTIVTAPLSERRDDILPLVRHFLARWTLEQGKPLVRWTPEVAGLLETYDWPGNVSELESEVERSLAHVSPAGYLDWDAFRSIVDRLDAADRARPGGDGELCVSSEDLVRVNAWESVPDSERMHRTWPSLADVQTRHIRETLDACRGNLVVAAQLLRVSTDELESLMQRWHIPRSLPRPARPEADLF